MLLQFPVGYMWDKRRGVGRVRKRRLCLQCLRSPRELDSGAVGLNSGRTRRCCIVSCLTPMSVRLLLSALARLIFPDGKVVGCLGTLGPLVDCVDRLIAYIVEPSGKMPTVDFSTRSMKLTAKLLLTTTVGYYRPVKSIRGCLLRFSEKVPGVCLNL